MNRPPGWRELLWVTALAASSDATRSVSSARGHPLRMAPRSARTRWTCSVLPGYAGPELGRPVLVYDCTGPECHTHLHVAETSRVHNTVRTRPTPTTLHTCSSRC